MKNELTLKKSKHDFRNPILRPISFSAFDLDIILFASERRFSLLSKVISSTSEIVFVLVSGYRIFLAVAWSTAKQIVSSTALQVPPLFLTSGAILARPELANIR